MAFVDSEVRSNYRAAEALIEDTYAKLTNPDVAAALGGYADVLLSYATNLYIPNIYNNEIKYPTDPETQLGTPLIITEPGITYRVDPQYYGVHPRIRERVSEYIEKAYETPRILAPETIFDEIEDLVVYDDVDRFISLKEDSKASVEWHSMAMNWEYRGKHYDIPFTTRPILLARPNFATKSQAGTGGIHELVHIDQAFRQPLSSAYWGEKRNETDWLTREIEAYTYESIAISALYPGHSPYIKSILTSSFSPYIDIVTANHTLHTHDDLMTAFVNHSASLQAPRDVPSE